ncbi:MAG: ribosome maturation factor RimM [Burkholderiaceae bacterium]|nr:ribosome maturation factor RimM [Burkholderiaceae bacterium]
MPVGHIVGAFGVQGWVRIKPYSADADALLHVRRWWLDKPELHDVDMQQAKLHADEVVAQLVGITGRDVAEALKGTVVQISRRHFPPLDDSEFYWVDLIGLTVKNLQDESLGTVSGLMESGAHPILRVAVADVPGAETKQREMLIPFVGHFIKTIDQAARLILVDWQPDY